MTIDHALFIPIIQAALAEDIGQGDITSQLLVPKEARARMEFVARQEMVACGTFIAGMVYAELEKHVIPAQAGIPVSSQENAERGIPASAGMTRINVQVHIGEGQFVKAGTVLAEASGPAHTLLAGERVVLNLMQRASGVATLTRAYVEAVVGTKAVILDTRKTMPGLRLLDKYAVRAGGGQNHRLRLDDMVLVKDNHIALAKMGDERSAMREIIEKLRKNLSDRSSLTPHLSSIPIVIECDTLAQVGEAIAAQPHRILLDNMSDDMLRAAVKLAAGKVPLEASGGVSLENVRAIAETGVDYISVGRITHSAPAVDIGADIRLG